MVQTTHGASHFSFVKSPTGNRWAYRIGTILVTVMFPLFFAVDCFSKHTYYTDTISLKCMSTLIHLQIGLWAPPVWDLQHVVAHHIWTNEWPYDRFRRTSSLLCFVLLFVLTSIYIHLFCGTKTSLKQQLQSVLNSLIYQQRLKIGLQSFCKSFNSFLV